MCTVDLLCIASTSWGGLIVDHRMSSYHCGLRARISAARWDLLRTTTIPCGEPEHCARVPKFEQQQL